MANKFVFVTGGVISSLGKGITSASLGRLLKSRGYKISIQKMDPYLNIDPGLLSPMQHGEAFITEDGTAADLDLGHYERFVDVNLSGTASVTTGKIHKTVMEYETAGKYKGGTVQIIPHVTNEIKARIVANSVGADVAIVEIGGTVGDIESQPYLEAIRQMQWDWGAENCCYMHLTLLPYVGSSGELKTKPTQHSVKELRAMGIQPDIIVCRTEYGITSEAREKIALFCNVNAGNVVQNKDVESLYSIPLMLEDEGLADIVCKSLGLDAGSADLTEWRELVRRRAHPEQNVKVAMVGKYVALHDAYLSVAESIEHAGIYHKAKVEVDWILPDDLNSGNINEKLGDSDAILLPGGYGERGSAGIILAAKYARENNKPMLAIGYGMQLAAVEVARSIAGLAGAHTAEADEKCAIPLVCIPKERMNKTESSKAARMGAFDIDIASGTKLHEIYKTNRISERHGNKYEINTKYIDALKAAGLVISARAVEGNYVEALELRGHKWFVGVIYHPEYKSRLNRPHPLFTAFLEAALKDK